MSDGVKRIERPQLELTSVAYQLTEQMVDYIGVAEADVLPHLLTKGEHLVVLHYISAPEQTHDVPGTSAKKMLGEAFLSHVLHVGGEKDCIWIKMY